MRAGRPLGFERVRSLLAADGDGDALRAYYSLGDGTFALLTARPDRSGAVFVGISVDPELVAREAESARRDATARLLTWTASGLWLRALAPLSVSLAEHTAPGEQIWFAPHASLHHIPLHALTLDGEPLAAHTTPSATRRT